MKGWEVNAVEYERTHKAGNCPKCGSANVIVEKMEFPHHVGIFFKCDDCGSWDHFDGVNKKD